LTSQIPLVKEVRKMNEMLAYSIHLGNDKNKTKKAKQLAKNNQSNTTSFSNNSIQNATHLSKANNHNLRKYDNQNELISIIYGTNNLVNDVKNLYLQEFENARIEYNNKQTRDDRKIENYFEHGYNAANKKNFFVIRGSIRDEETILFTIEDNGFGMEEENLQALNRKLREPITSEQESYGLRNLHQRLCLFYGGECGIYLHSKEEPGLVIEMIIMRKK